ncbi:MULTISPECIES: MmoB/DmpM family protein [Variovorax]|jgi:phenol hydroxylase P2 protein|uniref:MmoB/DmpM family protein n=1 Tax=Variovorax TaxID=34072 RepID=UPI002578FBDA|nr:MULTISPECIES: MmoB/DmpM family protein [unclassified Variovorax]HET7837677.1 MmoB/DmpM family protein [Variovorax sp.]MDM0022036.1 MmoB/DmpM family protein [Variovorax sp. J22R187]MDM0029499.1 MmoB/DmpM family protein [Variovorax sp. J31P216]MDM0070483.1 MmoB/DmpM family protein [Variovorax sp. J31P207]MDM0084317.1 MmoB/DmpM family protein [Variovorax sp. J31P179]
MTTATADIARPPVFIALQTSETARAIVEAILADNPGATAIDYPAMVKVDAPGRLVIRQASVEERVGRRWDLQEIHLSLISLSGSIEETDDEFILHWGA